MKFVIAVAAVLATIYAAEAYPRYIAIPLEDLMLLEVPQEPVTRVVRSANLQAAQLQDAESVRFERQAGGGDHHDVVDYGAHTGHHGAFGWYADFPVHSHGH